ncbi:MAG: proteasome accessory factor PafA2 family protein [Verrucomicrobia bacterium]|nr:proteasome accessory factor PafA2 family protein [Verrucomicrobiota bacterium]
MRERLMGVETEYAFTNFRKDGSVADLHETLARIEALAEERLHFLPAKGQRGVFLENGARFYRDFGGHDAHQEFATPECPNPWDAVRYILAGEEILLGLSTELSRREPTLGQGIYFKHNVDYSGQGTSWGCHESYLTRTSVEELPVDLVPHLVSRLIYTGAGGFNPFSRNPDFMISPRVAHLSHLCSPGSEYSRPIFHTRDESLSAPGHHRLHVICGESLCSHTAMWLRSGTTALVTALVDGGLRPGSAVALASPVEAMRTYARDPSCRATALLKDGRHWRALDIQRHYLSLAEAHLEAGFMPPWARQVCQSWRAILERLEQGTPESVAFTLDWAIKYALYQDRCGQRGLDLERLAAGGTTRKSSALREELFELDLRFGQVGEQGVFTRLDRAGVLAHRFPGVDNIEHAVANPPNFGRALLRGRAVRGLSQRGAHASCDWQGVWDLETNRFLDLSDPFAETERWKAIPHRRFDGARSFPRIEDAFCEVQLCYDRGAYAAAWETLRALEALGLGGRGLERSRCTRLKALVQARRGHLEGRNWLREMHGTEALTAAMVADYLEVERYGGLAPRSGMEAYLIQAATHVRHGTAGRFKPVLEEHRAAFLSSRGEIAAAAQIWSGLLNDVPASSRFGACLRGELGNARRILGKTDEAHALLELARESQHRGGFEGDLAGVTLPALAKLTATTDREHARQLLAEARTLQEQLSDQVGLARTCLLEARLGGDAASAGQAFAAVQGLRAALPAMAECRLLGRILERWDVWVRDPTAGRGDDRFWGL